MTSIIPFLRQNAFDAETTKVMGEAYDAACDELGDRRPPALLKEVIAKRIIDAAEKGERDRSAWSPRRWMRLGCAAASVGLRRQFDGDNPSAHEPPVFRFRHAVKIGGNFSSPLRLRTMIQ